MVKALLTNVQMKIPIIVAGGGQIKGKGFRWQSAEQVLRKLSVLRGFPIYFNILCAHAGPGGATMSDGCKLATYKSRS